VKSENHCPLTALGFTALCFDLSCGENLLLIFSKTRMMGCCGRVHWLLGEGQQLFWLLSPEHLIMITQTIFAEYKYIVHCQFYMATRSVIPNHPCPQFAQRVSSLPKLYVHILVIVGRICMAFSHFFLWLPFCPSKICLVLLRHILVLPIHTLVAAVMHGLGI
jgi:hypothetical protein